MAAPPPDSANAMARFTRPRQTILVRFAKRIRDPVNSWFARQSNIETSPVVSPQSLPQLQELERNWRVIRHEAAQLLSTRENIPAFGEISPDHRRIASGTYWKSFFFEGYGYKSKANRAKCPQTAAMLDNVPGLVVAFFSILEPGSHIPRHRGLTKAWLNCHLPLMVPKGSERCEMQIGGERVQWKEGEWQVFDETFAHEVWNESDEARVVLMLQVRRPMRWPGRVLSRMIFEAIRRTGFVSDVKKAVGA